MIELVATAFVILHPLDGGETAVNPAQITSITKTRDGEGNKVLSPNVDCVVGLSNGKFVSVIEPCSEVLRRIIEVEGVP